MGWVAKAGGGFHSTFQVTQTVEVLLQVVWFGWQDLVEFHVAPEHMVLDHLVCGWPVLRNWEEGWGNIMKNLEIIITAQKDVPEMASLMETSDGNILFADMDDQIIETDDFLWVDESKSIDIPVAGDALDNNQKLVINNIIQEYAEVFEETIMAGGAKVPPMRIEMKEEWNTAKRQPLRKCAPAVQAAMDFELERQLRDGIVEPSLADSGAPVLMVRKESSESGFRFCVDFTETNKYVITNPFPLLTIQTILSSVGGAQYFAKLDLRSGYWQFPVHEEDRHKLAFQVQNRVYQYCRTAMGHVDSSFHVQREMDRAFAEHIGKGVFIYLDDIIIYACDFDQFSLLLNSVFTILITRGLRCRGDKCEVGVMEVHCLGHILSRDGVKMSASRIAAVNAMPFPRSAKELRRYLGSANYMRNHIPNISLLTKPLSSRVNEPVSGWPLEEIRSAFEAVQAAVANQIDLVHLDYTKTVVVTTDASVLKVGGCISNRYVDESGETINRIVSVASHAFTDAESRWKTIEQEAFGVVWMVLGHRSLLWGHPFILETDHRHLLYIHGGGLPRRLRGGR